jgi:ArsR family transcriptional regulator, lead/cadmium/zinc/bismuth-responsive transcriptional repressor
MAIVRDGGEENRAHAAQVKRVQKEMPDPATVQQVSDIFGMLADPTRARLVLALSHAELCVCDLAALLGMSMSAVSHQLRLLRQMGLVKFRKEGRMAYYSLGDEHAHALLTQALRHAAHTSAPEPRR